MLKHTKPIYQKATVRPVQIQLFPTRQILDSCKLKECADANLRFDENGSKFSKNVENTVGKKKMQLLVFPRCFQRLVLQTHKNQGLSGNWLKHLQTTK